MIKEELKCLITQSLQAAAEDNKLAAVDCGMEPAIEKPRLAEHGDFACGIALKLASKLKTAPLQIAETIAGYVREQTNSQSIISKVTVLPPGYINFSLDRTCLSQVLKEVLAKNELYGRGVVPKKEHLLIEYVSANPTGELHIGHGRNAVYGSCLANLFKFAGYQVEQEFYINDTGEQIALLGKCAWVLYGRHFGINNSYPQEGYPEDSLSSVVNQVAKGKGDSLLKLPESEGVMAIATLTMKIFLDNQKRLLDQLKVHFDRWFSELDLHSNMKVSESLERLHSMKATYESEGALWLKAKELGDERDRVLRKSSGSTTYLANDAAYHADKFGRGYTKLINVWGADHHGQVPGLKAVVQAMGYDPDSLEIILTQIVNLLRDGKSVRMSKRAGTVVTLAEVMEEVGVDATRYYLAESNPSNPISFDLELAKQNSKENPAFYVQYAHARCSSILKRAVEPVTDTADGSVHPAPITQAEWTKLEKDFASDATIFDAGFDSDAQIFEHQKNLVMRLEAFPQEVQEAVAARLPGRLARYAYELANDLQKFYEVSRVIVDDPAVMKARLGMVAATKQVLANALGIIGVSAPEKM